MSMPMPTPDTPKRQLFTRDEVLAYANGLLGDYVQRHNALLDLPNPTPAESRAHKLHLQGQVDALKQAAAACCTHFGLELHFPNPQLAPRYLDIPASLAGDPDARVPA